MTKPYLATLLLAALALLFFACGDDAQAPDADDHANNDNTADSDKNSGTDKVGNDDESSDKNSGTDSDKNSGTDSDSYTAITDDLPPAGHEGGCAIPDDAKLEDTTAPDHVIGSGTPESCTSQAVVDAVAKGGIITFDCGPDPVTIVMEETAKVVNDAAPKVVIDGKGLVTLSGGGKRRILYMNTCDQDQVWTTPHCDNQDHPQLTVQNLTFIDADASDDTEHLGGGAIYASGGRFKVINSRFFNNRCADTGPDLAGAAIRAFQQYNDLPAYVVHSTFGGRDDLGNACANGGGLGSIGVSWTIINSLFRHNRAVGHGGNPAQDGTPGGGSGGAIYNDGNTITLTVCGSRIEDNRVNAYGSAIFFVSNNHTGTIHIKDSTIQNNTGGSWEFHPGISAHDDTTYIEENSVVK